MYSHVKRHKAMQQKETMDLVKMICSFINPAACKKLFMDTEVEEVENVGFWDDLKKIDPKMDPAKYKEYVEEE